MNPMDEQKIGVLKMLFAEHHRQLTEKRQKIHNVSEKTLAIFLAIAGWLVFTKEPMTPGVRWIIIIVVVVVAVGAARSIYINNRSFYSIAAVIGRVNHALGLFELGKFVPDEALYPDAWRDFGNPAKATKAALFHIFAVSAAAGLCIFAALMRN